MNKQEAIKKVEQMGEHERFVNELIPKLSVLNILNQLDEPETGHADEAPRYVKNILARLRELPLHDREVWLKVIMSEFKQDFSRAKWREGYEQGKVEGMVERDKVTIPQFVAEYIERTKNEDYHLLGAMTEIRSHKNKEIDDWFYTDDNIELFARAWIYGYEVEKEKRYIIKFKNIQKGTEYLKFDRVIERWYFGIEEYSIERTIYHTRKELEEANFGWVFSCEGIEIEEITE